MGELVAFLDGLLRDEREHTARVTAQGTDESSGQLRALWGPLIGRVGGVGQTLANPNAAKLELHGCSLGGWLVLGG